MATRTPLAVLNELSLPVPAADVPVHDLIRLLDQFVGCMRAARKIRPDLGLAMRESLGHVPVDRQGRSYASLAAQEGGRAKDLWRYIQSSRNFAPFATIPAVKMPECDEQFEHEGMAAIGLGVACVAGQLGVSFASDGRWHNSKVELVRRFLMEDSVGGQLEEHTEEAAVIHASTVPHVTEHERRISDLALPDQFAGDDLWRDREHLYPWIEFLPQVKGQLQAHHPGTPAVQQIHECLSKLNESTAAWNPEVSAFPEWKTHVTPESARRKELCWFTDSDGARRCFDLHARFTPGAQRIHFRLVYGGGGRLRIAHVGPKLG